MDFKIRNIEKHDKDYIVDMMRRFMHLLLLILMVQKKYLKMMLICVLQIILI